MHLLVLIGLVFTNTGVLAQMISLKSQSYNLEKRNGTARDHCPNLDELPIVDEWNKQFYGARVYMGRGHSVPDLSCNGPVWEALAPQRDSAPDGRGYTVGSLYVHAGCTFYGFENYGWDSWYKEFSGPLFLSEVPEDSFGHWCYFDDAPDVHIPCCHSYVIDCRMRYPDCVASDSWATVGYFDNSGSSVTSTYTYTQSIGSSWSEEMTNGFSVSTTVEVTMKESFFGIFEQSLAISATTGYDWSQTTTAVQETVTEHSVSTEVPPGTVLQIEHAVGHCGDSEVNTDMFRAITSKNGKIMSTEIFRV